MMKPRLFVFGLIVSALMLTGGFGQAASWFSMNQRMLDVDRPSDLVVKIKKKKHHGDDGDNKTHQKGERPIEASKPAPAEPETIQPGTDIEIQPTNIQNR
jgi:hypothetical protein